MSEEQLAFNIEGMIHEAAVASALAWTGSPLNFTTAYHSPAELDAAFEHWHFLHAHDKTHINSRMWRRSITVPESSKVAGHGFVLYTTDLRCEPWKHADKHETCLCVGDLMYQAICEPCEWNGIADRENDAVELWHDHALPGWRELPIVPSRLRMLDKDSLSKAAKKWVSERRSRCRFLVLRSSLSAVPSAHDTSLAGRRGVATTSPTQPSTRTASLRGRSRFAGRRTSRRSRHALQRRPASGSATKRPEANT